MHAQCREDGQVERGAEDPYCIETAAIRPQGSLCSVKGVCAKNRSAARITYCWSRLPPTCWRPTSRLH